MVGRGLQEGRHRGEGRDEEQWWSEGLLCNIADNLRVSCASAVYWMRWCVREWWG